MIVIDASALAKYLLREPDYDKVEQYLVAGVHSIDHLVKEVASAIRKHAVVYRKISVQDARELYRALLMLLEGGVVVLEAQEKYVHQAFNMALNYEITVYDALYIAQAAARSSKLLTSDRVQAVVAEKLGVEVLYV